MLLLSIDWRRVVYTFADRETLTPVTHRRNDRNVRPILKDTFDQVDIVLQVLALFMMAVFHQIGLHIVTENNY